MVQFDKAFNQVPDVWYDLYVRIFPGVYFCIALLFFYRSSIGTNSIGGGITMVLAGYIIGHMAQPSVGWCVGKISKSLRISERRKYLRSIRIIDANSRDSLIMSKQHAEVASMISFMIFTILLSIIILTSIWSDLYDNWSINNYSTNEKIYIVLFGILLSIVFFISAIERGKTLLIRINRLIEDAEHHK